jgi:CRISPR-associated endonuclease Cas1
MRATSLSIVPRNEVLALSGYGIRISVERGHLAVTDGIGSERRSGRFSRATAGFKRLVIIGHSGIVSLEALRWLHGIGAAFVQIDNDGQLIVASESSGLNEVRLRRAQALAATNETALEISRELVAAKLRGQAKLMERLAPPERGCRELDECLPEVARTDSIEGVRRVEGKFALIYWKAWHGVPVRFAGRDVERMPEHWLTLGHRYSLLSRPSPRRATNPANAVLNYLYAIVEAEARIAALRMGLDPRLGFLHADQKARNSLACDLMEPVRPKVDGFVLDLLAGRAFKKTDFFETREGICRLMPPLTHELAETGPIWARQLGPVTEQVAQKLFDGWHTGRKQAARSKAVPSRQKTLPTPLTESNRSAGRKPFRRKREPKTAEEMGASAFS